MLFSKLVALILQCEIYGHFFLQTCSVINPTQMECPSPAINLDWAQQLQGTPYGLASRHYEESHDLKRGYNNGGRRRSRGIEVRKRIGFIMDNVESVLHLHNYLPADKCQLIYVEDPTVIAFPENLKRYKGDTLVIEVCIIIWEVEHFLFLLDSSVHSSNFKFIDKWALIYLQGDKLNEASDETDIKVLIGSQYCNVTSLAQMRIVCTPPELQPRGNDDRGIPMVTVRVGRFLKFQVGYLQYELMKNSVFPVEAYWIAATAAFIVLVLCAAVVFVYRRKSTQAEREYKRIQIQMDTLESNVRSECKQGMYVWKTEDNTTFLVAL